jgi:hypothetical protein
VTERARRLAAWALVLAVGATVAVDCGNDGGHVAQPSAGSGSPLLTPVPSQNAFQLPPCEYPKKVAFPKWVPSDLPLPHGTYATEVLPSTQGYNRGLFVARMSLQDFVKFVLAEWPKKGWVLGRGDAEQGEADDQFTRPPSVGAFRAREEYCKPGFVLLLVIYIPDRSKIDLPTGSPLLSPHPSASPSA